MHKTLGAGVCERKNITSRSRRRLMDNDEMDMKVITRHEGEWTGFISGELV
jgi:hypothetical protein